MNAKSTLILAAVVLTALYWFFRDKEKPPAPPAPTKIQTLLEAPVVSATNTPRPVIKAEARPMIQPNQKPVLPKEPFAGPMEFVHFKVEDGLAVTFGDVILGVPMSQEPIQEGYNKPAVPRPWIRPEIPYVIHPSLKNPERVETALKHISESTVVQFVPVTNQPDSIIFENGEANCKSYLGRIGGQQPIKLSDQCGWLEVVHEVMHAMGFIHEHSRTDRDQYLEINWSNVKEEFKPQYAMVTEDLMGPLKNLPFDYHSLMLYPPTMFADRPGEPTMKSRSQEHLSPSDRGLSSGDIEKINRLFR